jgi:hypothetical protein
MEQPHNFSARGNQYSCTQLVVNTNNLGIGYRTKNNW